MAGREFDGMACFWRQSVAVSLALMLTWLACGTASALAFNNPKARPPRAKPHRRSGGESVPPLPLPATPLRRSERKRQPAPPALIGMITFTGQPQYKIVQGQRRRVAGQKFPTTQVDIASLMRYANSKLKIRYRYMQTSLAKFSWDPTELPLLYITGWTPMPRLDKAVIARLRRYLYDGGTLVLHAQCGRGEFHLSARRELAKIFPKRKLAMVDTDSPLFKAYFNIPQMRLRLGNEPVKTVPPLLEAVYLGCRPAILLSAVDLNCSWDIENKPIGGGLLYHREDGLKLGVNIITTTLANFQYARAWGTQKQYPKPGPDSAGQELVVAQVAHAGDWDPTPHGLANLMKYIRQATTLKVQFQPQSVGLTDVEVFRHPVLYMTGLGDFKLARDEVLRLREYLSAGGVLIAEAAAGRKAFDVAFRREIKRVLPAGELKLLPPGSPVYQRPFQITTVNYTAMVKAANPALNAPMLEGITVAGQLGVIYSSMGLASGWEQLGLAYNRGYADTDALRLGVNIITYAMTH